jgi:hypothetical protein
MTWPRALFREVPINKEDSRKKATLKLKGGSGYRVGVSGFGIPGSGYRNQITKTFLQNAFLIIQ